MLRLNSSNENSEANFFKTQLKFCNFILTLTLTLRDDITNEPNSLGKLNSVTENRMII